MQGSSKHRSRRRARQLRGKRAVSDVLGTILILALTVTLFSSIFFLVSTFPKPATQPASQFDGQLFYSFVTKGAKTWTNVSYLTLTHLAGPLLFNFNTQIYVVSQTHPQNTTAVYSLTSGGLGASSSASWGTGQVWNVSLAADHLTTPDNITVTIVSGNSVVYQQRLPGSNPTTPPIFDQEGTVPGSPTTNGTFVIFVQISDPFLSTTSKKVYLNITTPGLTCSGMNASGTKLPMTYSSSSGLWSIPGCAATVAGTYYVTVWVTDANPISPLMNSVIFPVVVSAAGGGGGGGGGCSNTYTVTLTANPTTTTDGSVVALNLTVKNGNACDWILVSGNFSAVLTSGTGTVTNPAPVSITGATVPVGGSLYWTTASWTAPSKTCNPGGNKTCTGTATITFTFSYSSGAVGSKTVSVLINF